MNTPTPLEHPPATPGICACGRRVIRGDDNTGALVTVDVWKVDAATELIAYSTGRASFVLALVTKPTGLTLRRRTANDIKRRPSGFRNERIVLAHQCRLSTEKGTDA